jgi:N-ethylmaleimide reductase
MSASLFSPLRLGALTLKHRVVMAPLTRMRAEPPRNVPVPLNALYYGQRTTDGGLLIAEATPVCPEGHGHPDVPGIYTREQIAGWRLVTRAVHEKGGFIYLQLWHTGRVSHSRYQPDGGPPFGPSAVQAAGDMLTPNYEKVPYELPRVLSLQQIKGIVAAFGTAASNALEAGFDGVEIHGANGYLLEQFLQSRSNLRDDEYGGSIAKRARFHLEVTQAVVKACGADRVGMRLSPWGIAQDSGEADPYPLYRHLIEAMAPMGLAYLHIIEPRTSGMGKTDAVREDQPSAVAIYRPHWPGVLIAAGGFDGPGAAKTVAAGNADAVAFGRFFISNPDLPLRIQRSAPLNPYIRSTFYGGGAKGYTDYPALESDNA